MGNHPNRQRQESPAANPAPTQIRIARESAGLTQTQAAEFIYSTLRAWQDWEAGARRMHPGLWELWQIKTKHLYREARVHASLAAMIAREGGSQVEIADPRNPIELPASPGVYLISSRSADSEPWHAEIVGPADISIRQSVGLVTRWNSKEFPNRWYRTDFVEIRDRQELRALYEQLRATGYVESAPVKP